jgi:thioesterase domain-containing protein/acyl carrier protein
VILVDFLADLERLGVQLWAENGQLRYRAPAHTMTDDLRAELARRKPDLLNLFDSEWMTALERVPLPPVTPAPERRHDPFPLTDIQQAYWIGRGSGFELGNVGTHAYFEFEALRLDVERLSSAWQSLILRHEMLRAVVHKDGQQQVLESVEPYVIGVTDLRAVPESDGLAVVAEVRERMAHQVYDPARWPLFEVRATRLPGGVRVHVSIDLLIADVWSLFILFREWGALYESPSIPLPPIALSFRDYVAAEAALQATPHYARAQAYWAMRLADLRPGPDLPLARSPAAVGRPRFERRSGRIEAGLWGSIKARSRQYGLTPSMVLCAAFADVLAAWSREPRFTLNLTLFHRMPVHPEVNAVVGDFTSTVLLAVDAGGTADVVERGRRLQRQLWSDLEHRYVSGVRVLRELAQRAGDRRRLAMPVVFTSTLGHETADAAAATRWLGALAYGISQTAQVWLDHQVGEDGAALVFNWDAVEALFPAGLLDAMFAAYCTRLRQLGTDEGAWSAPVATPHPTSADLADPHATASAPHAGAPAAARPFVAPRDETERQLVRIWEELLGMQPVGVTDSFFDLGGNSFLAARLMIRVRERFGCALPVSTLFQASDIEGLARFVRERPPQPASSLVHLAGGIEPPFFCVHPIGGNVICYVDLARRLRPLRTFWGLQAVGLQGEADPFTDIAAMAAHYREQICVVQPRGPYLLGGWSMGGTVAFEVARQLQALGEATSRLVLIDCETTAVAAATGRAVRQDDPAEPIPADVDRELLGHMLDVFASHDRALRQYRERSYPGPVTVIRAREQPDVRPHDLGWGSIATGGVDVHVVNGNHYTILQPPNVDALAARLGGCLESTGT